MAKKELRLAVVIYGGASLAVYMHGVSKELLKLVRASKVLHEQGAERATGARFDQGPDRREADTENVYYEILERINREGHFRVVIDVVAGASAGAINGVMLAKAVVDDAALDAQTELWMNDADVERLGQEQVTRWRKWYLYPFLRALSYWLPRDIAANPETRGKIARFVRSSWFQPPFSGEQLCHHFFNGLDAMAASRRAGSTLLPPGQRLDVYASITDLFGYPRTIRLHDQLVAREKEHAAYCQLSHLSTDAGRRTSDFRDDNDPALVWAARASSSYAGAFPPFHHGEMVRVLEARRRHWPREQSFLQGNLHARDGSPAFTHFDPADRYFVDGGIVNNKPFGAALMALNDRPADRQVDRCLVYIEPDPNIEEIAEPEHDLGYLSTIRAALSSIPRNQPILDDLNEVMTQDARVQVNRRIIESNRADINRMVRDVQQRYDGATASAEHTTELRVAMADETRAALGLAHRVYVQRRLWRLVDALVASWAALAAQPPEPITLEAMSASLAQWWEAEGADEDAREGLQRAFLERFDVSFRIRRLQFLIRRINRREDELHCDPATTAELDGFKQRAYGFMEACYRMRRSEQIDDVLARRLAHAAGRVPLRADDAQTLLQALAASLDLEALDRALDQALYRACAAMGDRQVAEGLLADYVGFPMYDVLLLAPGSLEGGPDPLTPIRVERISPSDAPSLAHLFDGLRCRSFMGFVGFFNRGYREHDYLWGRLNGAERMVDLLAAVAGDAMGDSAALKRALFAAIVARERGRLQHCGPTLDAIEAALRPPP